MNNPLFSVVTVCLNDKKGLMRTYQSVCAQVNLNYEWLVVDGASEDGTKEFLEQLPIGICQWISESDKGLYDAMNKGIKRATGEYLIFLNSGDELASEDVLENVAQVICKGVPPEFIYGDAYEENEAGQFCLKRAYTHRMVWYGMFAHHQSMFFSRSCMPDAYSTSMRYASDYGFVAAHLKRSTTVHRVAFPICNFETGGISQTGSTLVANREQWEVRRTIFKYSVFKCQLIHWLHEIILGLKKNIPSLYRLVRFGYGKN